MNTRFLENGESSKLLARVRDDLSLLRQDVGTLVSRTARRTVPDQARSLARSGRDHLRQGRDFAAGQVRHAGEVVKAHPTSASLAGALLLGAVAAGAYLLIRGMTDATYESDE